MCEYPTPNEVKVFCTKNMTEKEIEKAITELKSQDLPDTTIVIFTKTPISVTLTQNKDKAILDVKVDKEESSLSEIDQLLGYFHALVDANPKINVAFEVVGGNTFTEKLSDMYTKPPTEEYLAEFVEKNRDGLEEMARFNQALYEMQTTGKYDPSYTEKEVLDWYDKISKVKND